MPAPKRRHQKEPPSGEPKQPGDSPEPKRRQRGSSNLETSVTQGQPITNQSSAVSSDHPISPPPAPSSSQVVQQLVASLLQTSDTFPGVHQDMSSNRRAVREHSAGGGGPPLRPRARYIYGRRIDDTPTSDPESFGAAPPASATAGPQYPPPPGRPPPPPPPPEPELPRSATSPNPDNSPKPVPTTLVTSPFMAGDAAIWGGLSEAEIRRQISMLEALERRRHGSHSPSPGPPSRSSISPLSSPPLSPLLAASRPNRLGPPPAPPPGFEQAVLVPNSPTHQSALLSRVATPPSRVRSGLGPPPAAPVSQSLETLPGTQPPRLRGPFSPIIRPEIVTASSLTRQTDRITPSEGPRPRRGAMSIHFDDSNPEVEAEAIRLYTAMRENPNQGSVDLLRDLEIARATAATLTQQGVTPTSSRSVSENAIGSLHRLISRSGITRSSSAPKPASATDKGKQPQARNQYSRTELRSRTRQLREAEDAHNTPSGSSASLQDPTFRFSTTKGYYEATVPMAYFMNNPNTRPLSTTDPFFHCFPSDPEELPFLRGTGYASRPGTPEIHLDETPEQKREYLRLKKKLHRKQDWALRKENPLPRSWYLQYSGHTRSTLAPRGHTLPNFPSSMMPTDEITDDPEFQEYLARIKKQYRGKRRASDRHGLDEEALDNPMMSIPFDSLAIDPIHPMHSRRTGRPEEAQPLEVVREPGPVPGPSSEAGPSSGAGPSSSSRAPEEEVGESSQGMKKESRRRK
ncbi:hypothetical protein TWF281_006322 [Arthrobotrys megalospora]